MKPLDDKKTPLNCDRDAARWAREFNETLKKAYGFSPLDEGWLIGWFANAMMCGEDTYRWRQEAAARSARLPIDDLIAWLDARGLASKVMGHDQGPTLRQLLRDFAASSHVEPRPHPDGDKVCDVCGGRVSACNVLGHRPESDRHIQWQAQPSSIGAKGAESAEATEGMLPCPSCGETDVDATFALASDGQVNAGCMNCGMAGPTSNTARDAADRWNALPRSATLPTPTTEAWLIVREDGSKEVVLSPLTDATYIDYGDEAWPLVRRADGSHAWKECPANFCKSNGRCMRPDDCHATVGGRADG